MGVKTNGNNNLLCGELIPTACCSAQQFHHEITSFPKSGYLPKKTKAGTATINNSIPFSGKNKVKEISKQKYLKQEKTCKSGDVP